VTAILVSACSVLGMILKSSDFSNHDLKSDAIIFDFDFKSFYDQ